MPERDLTTLLVTMKPALDPREWVFCHVERGFSTEGLDPLCTFRESEGVTLIVERHAAQARGLEFAFPSHRITLRVYSDLESVGLLAHVTAALARHGIAANAISAFHHDHIFVPTKRSEEALRILDALSAEHARKVL